MINYGLSPCKGCTSRDVTLEHNCHMDCSKYLAYRKRIDDGKAAAYAEICLNQYNMDLTAKIKKRQHSGRARKADQ